MVKRVGQLFDLVSPDYDNVGIDFFGPIAELLVLEVAPKPGESVLDLGCGSGAATVRLADAVGLNGAVTGLDVSPMMLKRAQLAVGDRTRADWIVGDASDPDVGERLFDAVTASLVIFFLPYPAAAMRRWASLVRPGGRVAATTFGDSTTEWAAAERELRPYLPGPDPRKSGTASPFASDAGVEALFSQAGLVAVSSTTLRVEVEFEDIEHFVRWSRSIGQRIAWELMPADAVPTTIEAMRRHLAPITDELGRIRVWQDVRCTLGVRPLA